MKKISPGLMAHLDSAMPSQDMKAAPKPGQERFCCNPKCKYHNNFVKPGHHSMMQGDIVKREYVTRQIEGVEITGPFCQVCLEVIKMFNL